MVTLDRTLLPAADFEFVILSDTHYMRPDVDSVEFESRRHQAARSAHALALVDDLDPAFVVHLGDLVQAFPGYPGFETAMDAAEDQLRRVDADVYHVAGNHDVGDKPDPTMPTDPVTPESLAAYHDRFGRSWYSWDRGDVHFVVLNSQLLGAPLPAAADQREWVEADLRAAPDGPVYLFLHLPPFLRRPDEPGLGHYDNVGRPARDWLLDLLREHSVDRVFSGHSHFSFRNRAGDTRLDVVPSVSFTRPGFGELFSSCPPPERGRDDRGKLGFLLVRMVDGDPQVHFVRTNGRTDPNPDAIRLLTRPTGALPDSRLGASLVRPLAESTTVPATFPSSIGQEVTNDYPALACLEAGLGYLRTPIPRLDDDLNRRRLDGFGAEGVTVVGTALVGGERDVPAVDRVARDLDEIELRLPAGAVASDDLARSVRAYRDAGVPVCLSAVVPERAVAGKQHDRLREAYVPSELDRLEADLAERGLEIDRVLRWIGTDADPWRAAGDDPPSTPRSRLGTVDWLVPTADVEGVDALRRIARAAFASARRPDARLYAEPLSALDRTMDPAPGLLDRRCNPTANFHAIRCLNTVLYAGGRAWQPGPERDVEGATVLPLERPDRAVCLVLPTHEGPAVTVPTPPEWEPYDRSWAVSLSDATIRPGSASPTPRRGHRVSEPSLLVFERGGVAEHG